MYWSGTHWNVCNSNKGSRTNRSLNFELKINIEKINLEINFNHESNVFRWIIEKCIIYKI